MRTTALSAVAIGLLVLSAAAAQTQQTGSVYPQTEYISGKDGFSKPIKGQLVIEEREIAFEEQNGNTLFTIPMRSVVSVTNLVETDPGGFGRKFVLGIYASKREEFLTVTVRTLTGAEAIVFKARKKTSDGMVAKVQFYQKAAASDTSASHGDGSSKQ